MVEFGKSIDMDMGIFIFVILFVFAFLLPWLTRSSSMQLHIYSNGFNKIPKLLLKLAKIHKEGDIKWSDLSSEEENKIMSYYKKFKDASSFRLTYLNNLNLIHVQQDTRSWFFPTDKGMTEIVQEEIGRLDKDTYVELVVYRRPGGWLRTPVLIGYLRKKRDLDSLKDEERGMEILFEFPEAIMRGSFLNRRYVSRYGLEEFKDFSVGESDFGEFGGFPIRTYDQNHKNGSIFHFQVEP